MNVQRKLGRVRSCSDPSVGGEVIPAHNPKGLSTCITKGQTT